jgi:hypothetical protein
MGTKSFTRDEVAHVLNLAADAIQDAADLADEGTIDALNLLVNAALYALDHGAPDTDAIDLSAAVEANYEEASLADVLRWIAS